MAGPSADDLKALTDMRLGDAQTLLAAERYSAAYYLAGYAVECALKAIIARSFRENVIPDRGFVLKVYSHDLNALVALADLKPHLDQRSRDQDIFGAKWSFVSGWSETSRYEIVEPYRAHMMLSAVADEGDGVLPWLKNYW